MSSAKRYSPSRLRRGALARRQASKLRWTMRSKDEAKSVETCRRLACGVEEDEVFLVGFFKEKKGEKMEIK